MDRDIQTATGGTWQHVSEVIDRLRRYWRLTQEQFAGGVGMSQRRLSGRLSCERHWNEEELAEVAAYFKVPVGDLFGLPEQAIASSAQNGGPDNASYVSSAEQQELFEPAPGSLLADVAAA